MAERRAKRARRAALAAAVIFPAGATAGALAGISALRPGHAAAAAGTVRVATAQVVRTDLTNTTQVSGSLGYSGSYTIVAPQPGASASASGSSASGSSAAGTYTALPSPGQVVWRGHHLYEVDGVPVVLFYGARPEWRALEPGITDGPDIAQLDANLIALGYASRSWLTVSDSYTSATETAIENWQAATGRTVNGVVEAGDIAYAPGPIRVTAVSVSLGATMQAGSPVLTGTSQVVVVEASVPVEQEYLVRVGERVTVTLPDGTTTTPGVVASVSRVASSSSNSSSGNSSPSASGNGSSGSGSQGNGSSSGATVQMTVRLTHQQAAGNLDQAPVEVNITSAQANNVLAVPVNALVALAGGGYAVWAGQGSSRHLVAVQTGLFTSTLVQVTGTGLSQGTMVEVPAQ
jgi:hypothetical protein